MKQFPLSSWPAVSSPAHQVAPHRLHHLRRQSPQDRTSRLIGWILQGGVLVSSALILLGIALLPLRPDGWATANLLAFPHTLAQEATGLLQFNPQAIITLGLLLLIATPITRVAASVLLFRAERDRRFMLITLLVLALLVLSLALGLSHPGSSDAIDLVSLHYSPSVVLAIFASSLLAGLLGSLVGLGGGVIIVPLLTIAFGFPITFAIGASIISVIATSSGAAAAYVRDHLTNVRIGMFLELATTAGAISGAFVAALLAPGALGILFGLILLISAAPLALKLGEELPRNVSNDRLASALHLDGSYPDHRLGREVPYQVTRTPWGLAMMYLAGLISGLLGIGSGTFKVIALDTLMRLPLKVSTTTSNFMIGVTAAASAGIYFSRGAIPPLLAAPVALGILLGSLVGARLLPHLSNKTLRLVFLPVLVIAAGEMILHGMGINTF